MKRIIYLSLFFSSVLLSCEKIPEAHFHTDTINPEVGHAVEFTSDSKHATRFEWDFGDGYASNDVNPSHIYTGTGPVTVTLNRSIHQIFFGLMVQILIQKVIK